MIKNALFQVALCTACVSLLACAGATDQEETASGAYAMAPPDEGTGGSGGGEATPPAAPPDQGCTLTQGFWKNHPQAWPVDSLDLGGVSYTAEALMKLLNTPPSGDKSLILAHQLIAAKLNLLSGASEPLNIADADAWMAANKDADGRLPYGTSTDPAGAQASSLGDSLASYNQGEIGPGHCDDGEGPTAGGKGPKPNKNR